MTQTRPATAPRSLPPASPGRRPVEYNTGRIKQYHKEGSALRTETTINDTRDFGIGKRLCNLPVLRKVGFSANRRQLDAQAISHDPIIGDTVFVQPSQPIVTEGHWVAGLRFGDPRVHTQLAAIAVFRLQPDGSPTTTCDNTSPRPSPSNPTR